MPSDYNRNNPCFAQGAMQGKLRATERNDVV